MDGGGDACRCGWPAHCIILVLSGRDDALAAVYPPNATPEAADAEAVFGAIVRNGDFIDRFLDSPPQTNETGRSAILLPAFLRSAERFDLPLILSELGSSAGLNQNWHRYRYEYGTLGLGRSGFAGDACLRVAGRRAAAGTARVAVADCAGCDIAPSRSTPKTTGCG
jgi:hypothetical protein